jgi:diacylglycerol kinase family enzyme
MKKFTFIHAPHLIYRLMNNLIHESRFFEMMTAKDILLVNNTALKAHIDGEPVTFTSNIHVKMEEKSLNVLVPNP